MVAFTVRQVLPGSLDAAGVSTATSTPDTSDPRQGQLYDPTLLAAASPVWFHPLPDGRCLGLLSRRLHTATVAEPQASGPLMYSSATETTVPSWALFHPASGALSGVVEIPTEVIGDRTLTSAASRGNYLFTLATIGDSALLQHFRVSTRGEQALVLEAEEVVPGGLGLGLHLERNDLWVFGARDGKLALARKNWGRVGENGSRNPFLRWRYHTASGWSSDSDDLEPLPGDVPTSGPVSVARHRMHYYLTMPVWTPPVAATGGAAAAPGRWDARTWTSRLINRRWSPHPFTVPLGGEGTYLGGTAHLQPQLPLRPGYTRTDTRRGETVLDGGSDHVQVFTGLASEVVVLPGTARLDAAATADSPATYRPYTIYNKTPTGEIRVVAADGGAVTTIGPGREATLTPTAAEPAAAHLWVPSAAPARNPEHRVGFPYVSTVRASGGGNGTLVTRWGVFGV